MEQGPVLSHQQPPLGPRPRVRGPCTPWPPRRAASPSHAGPATSGGRGSAPVRRPSRR